MNKRKIVGMVIGLLLALTMVVLLVLYNYNYMIALDNAGLRATSTLIDSGINSNNSNWNGEDKST